MLRSLLALVGGVAMITASIALARDWGGATRIMTGWYEASAPGKTITSSQAGRRLGVWPSQGRAHDRNVAVTRWSLAAIAFLGGLVLVGVAIALFLGSVG
jgi:hypothetical protein